MNGWQEQGTGHLVGGAGSRTTSLRSAAVSFRHVAGCTDLFAANANTVAGRTTNLRTRNGFRMLYSHKVPLGQAQQSGAHTMKV